jgi:hypothetical protein
VEPASARDGRVDQKTIRRGSICPTVSPTALQKAAIFRLLFKGNDFSKTDIEPAWRA